MARSRLLATLACVLPLLLVSHGSKADDAATSFSPTLNPAGSWRYGWTATRGGAFSLFATPGTDASGLDYWRNASNLAQVSHNGTATGRFTGTTVYTPPGGLNLQPGGASQYAVVRWTAPSTATYTIHARFFLRTFPSLEVNTEVAVLQGGAVLFDQLINAAIGVGPGSLDATVPITAGETIDFVVGDGEDGNSEVVGLDATVNREQPLAQPPGPVFAFAGQRFVGCRWPASFESIAFDPVNRRLASAGKIRDLCANIVSDGPGESPGLGWDLRDRMYWQITNDRRVRRWTAAGALLDTVFTIPLTFTVPGSGPDTLESVRGIATDSNFVYVVDAGPDPGTISSNAWFKFTRTGTPVLSSKSTDFTSHLDMDPDALVDDICYVPFGSPDYPGRLLIALEHSGIQVIDVNGGFVAATRWSQMGLFQRPMAAFAGITIDPATGNLYLTDNDAGAALVWTRLASQGATSYAVATVGSQNGATLVLKLPNPGCDLPLWKPYGLPATASGNLFGLGYRTVDRFVYTVDYGRAEMWRADPLLGVGQRVASIGPSSVWGLTYDTERDVFYLLGGGFPSPRIIVTDPISGSSHTLPQPIGYPIGGSTDLAWSSADHKIYASDRSVFPARLLRIDRDTGAAIIVGNLGASVAGLEYDPASGMLLGITGTEIYRIHPLTAATTLIGPLVGGGFEGLAVIPVPANPGVVSVETVVSPVETRLSAWPNPTRGGAEIAYALAVESRGRVSVYDVSGRRVRELRSGRLAAGSQRLRWDGRDDQGAAVPSGIYFIRVESPERTSVARLTLLD